MKVVTWSLLSFPSPVLPHHRENSLNWHEWAEKCCEQVLASSMDNCYGNVSPVRRAVYSTRARTIEFHLMKYKEIQDERWKLREQREKEKKKIAPSIFHIHSNSFMWLRESKKDEKIHKLVLVHRDTGESEVVKHFTTLDSGYDFFNVLLTNTWHQWIHFYTQVTCEYSCSPVLYHSSGIIDRHWWLLNCHTFLFHVPWCVNIWWWIPATISSQCVSHSIESTQAIQWHMMLYEARVWCKRIWWIELSFLPSGLFIFFVTCWLDAASSLHASSHDDDDDVDDDVDDYDAERTWERMCLLLPLSLSSVCLINIHPECYVYLALSCEFHYHHESM